MIEDIRAGGRPDPVGGPGGERPQSDRVAKWHAQNDDEFRRFLISIALPHTVEPLSAENHERVTRWFDVFEECLPTITAQDVMGLIVLRLMQEFLPEGELNEMDSTLATYKALALAIQGAPQRMQAAKFAVPQIALPGCVSERTLWEAALRVRRRWLDWYSDVMDPYRLPRSDREAVVRGLALLKCYRETVGEASAAKRAKELLDADLRRRGHGGANLDHEDIIGEMYALGRGEASKARLLRLRKDGLFAYQPRALRDLVRKARHGPSVKPGAVHDLSGRGQSLGRDPAAAVEVAELRARLLDRCDDMDTFIVEHWDDSNAEIGRNLGMTGQAVGKRRQQIKATAERLGLDLTA